MSITPPTGILDITDAIVRVSKLEFRGATGFDTILNNVARNTALLVDQNVEYTTDKAWGLKLPNAWVSEFDAYWDSGASGNIDFNIYNNTTSGTNGYVISMDDTTITVTYDGGSALETVSLGSTLKNDTWRKIHILFERDMISLALDGTPVLYFKDTLLRPRVYDEESGYVIASGLSADRKVKNLRILNGDKWMTDNTSNIAYVHGNVGIGTTQAAYTLDVDGDIRATGNLLIEGLTTTVDTQNLSIEDAIVEIGRGNDGGVSGKDVGFLFTRNNGADTTNSNVALIYDESTDRLTLGYSDGSPTASTLAINTSKSLDVVIPSGNLGVGTASPDNKLEIADHTSTNPTLLKLTCQTAANPGESNTSIQLAGTSAGNYGGYIEGYLDQGIGSGLKLGHINGSSAKNEYMRITNYGNVGIGTTNPTSKLYIQDDNADTKITIRGGGSTVNDANVTIQLLETPSNFLGGAIQYSGISAIQGLRFGHYVNSSTPRIDMVIDRGTGNVGIGTASPDGKLDIYTGSASTVALSFDRYASGNYRTDIYQNQYGPDFRVGYNTYTPESVLYLKRFSNGTKEVEINGNVGIGTASPGQALHVYRSGVASRVKIEAPSTQETEVQLYHTGDAAAWSMYMPGSSDSLRFYRNGDKMTLTSDGNVGIGTANPGYKLHISAGSSGVNITGPTQGNSGGPNNDPWAGLKLTRLGTNGETYNGDVALRAYRWATSGQDPAMALDINMSSTAPYNRNTVATFRSNGRVGIGTAGPQCGLDIQSSGTRCSYPFGIGGSSTYASRVEFGVGVANNAGGWTRDFVVGAYERGGWIRVFSGATQSAGASSGAVQNPQEASFVYSIYGSYLYWSRVSGSTSISLSCPAYQTVRVSVSGGGSYTWGYIEAYQQGGIAIF